MQKMQTFKKSLSQLVHSLTPSRPHPLPVHGSALTHFTVIVCHYFPQRMVLEYVADTPPASLRVNLLVFLQDSSELFPVLFCQLSLLFL